MTHVFIVDDRTFKYHLEYMFAGTGSPSEPLFLLEPECSNANNVLPAASEINLSGMIADISRVHINDKIIFYLMKKDDSSGGLFFGVFKVKSDPFFNDKSNNYLGNELGKYLSLRVEIEPFEVYSKGVKELDVIDNIEGIEHPWQMCWSLIYRKLKAGRGCTMITDYEANRIIEMIRVENDSTQLASDHYTFSNVEQKITTSDNEYSYGGLKRSINIYPRLKYKNQRSQSFESHLQACILQNLHIERIKNVLLGENTSICWIGNEVKCSFGMQSMDIVILDSYENVFRINLIELKDEEPYERIVKVQLKWYIKWLIDYLVPTLDEGNIVIRPVIIAKKPSEDLIEEYNHLCIEEDYPNSFGNSTIIKPIELFGFEVGDDELCLEKLF